MTSPDDPLCRFFAHRLCVAVTHLVAPLLSMAALAYLMWLGQETIPAVGRSLLWSVMGCMAALMVAGFLGLWGKVRGWGLFATSAGVAFLGGCALLWAAMADVFVPFESWMGVEVAFFLAYAGLAVPLVCSLWWVAAASVGRLSAGRECGVTFGGFALLVMGLFATFLLFAQTGAATWLEVPVCLLLGCAGVAWVFHLLGLWGWWSRRMREESAPYHKVLCAIMALGLPLCGLALNTVIPFPFDCQNVWCYGLTLLTGTLLLVPTTRVTAFLRWATLPFTLYFFLVFLPWLPLVPLAMVVVGAGFLVLAPAFLLWTHVTRLRERRLPVWVVAVALLVMPVGFLLLTERDRADVRLLVEHVATPDYTSGRDALPLTEGRARAAAHAIYGYERAASVPLLSLWRNLRLFDGLHPRQETLDALVARFGRPEAGFADGFFGRQRRGRERWTVRPARTERAATVAFRGLEGRKVTACLTLPADEGKEFVVPIALADGVWVIGLRLTMPNDGPWRKGTLRDRRAATWVYNRLTEQRIDPALLTLDTPTRGTLRVSPLEKVPRRVEIDLLLPRTGWCATPLALTEEGAPLRPLPPGEADARREVKVCFVAAGEALPREGTFGLYVVGARETFVSETPPERVPCMAEDFDARRALCFAQGYAYAHNLRLGQATFVGKGWGKLRKTYRPEPPRAPLPMLPPDDPWQVGAQMWQLAGAMRHNQTLDHRPTLRDLAARCGVLTPFSAYLVVENEVQERALAAKDATSRHANLAFDIDPTSDPHPQSAPGFLFLAALFALFCALLTWLRPRILVNREEGNRE